MDVNRPAPPKSLQVNEEGIYYLGTASRWSKFLAVVLFICIGFVLVSVILVLSDPALRSTTGKSMLIIYSVMTAINLAMGILLLRFSSKAQAAIISRDEAALTASMKYLGKFFAFTGIITIIAILLGVIAGVAMTVMHITYI